MFKSIIDTSTLINKKNKMIEHPNIKINKQNIQQIINTVDSSTQTNTKEYTYNSSQTTKYKMVNKSTSTEDLEKKIKERKMLEKFKKKTLEKQKQSNLFKQVIGSPRNVDDIEDE